VIDNPAPVAGPDANAVLSNDKLDGNVLANDFDPDGDPMSVGLVNGRADLVGQPVIGSAGGTFTIQANGDYHFDPGSAFDALPAGESSTTQIVYTTTDSGGATSTTRLSVVVTASDAADVPSVSGLQQTDQTNSVPDNSDWLDGLRQIVQQRQSGEDGHFTRLPEPTTYFGRSQGLGAVLGPSGGNLYVEIDEPGPGEQPDSDQPQVMSVRIFGESPDGRLISGASVEITLPNDDPLPGWIRLAGDGSLVLTPPASLETVKLRIVINAGGGIGQSYLVEIDLRLMKVIKLDREIARLQTANPAVTAA